MDRKRTLGAIDERPHAKKRKIQKSLNQDDQALVDQVENISREGFIPSESQLNQFNTMLTENTDLDSILSINPHFIYQYKHAWKEKFRLFPNNHDGSTNYMYFNDIFLSIFARIDPSTFDILVKYQEDTFKHMMQRCSDTPGYNNNIYFAAIDLLTEQHEFITYLNQHAKSYHCRDLIHTLVHMRMCAPYKYACSAQALRIVLSFFENTFDPLMELHDVWREGTYSSQDKECDRYILHNTREVLVAVLQLVSIPVENRESQASTTNAWDLRIQLCSIVMNKIIETPSLLFTMIETQECFNHLRIAASACKHRMATRLCSAGNRERIIGYMTRFANHDMINHHKRSQFIIDEFDIPITSLLGPNVTDENDTSQPILPAIQEIHPVIAIKIHYTLLSDNNIYGYAYNHEMKMSAMDSAAAKQYYETQKSWYDYRLQRGDPNTQTDWSTTIQSHYTYQQLKQRMLKLNMDQHFLNLHYNHYLLWCIAYEHMTTPETSDIWQVVKDSLKNLNAQDWIKLLSNKRIQHPCLLTVLTEMAARGHHDLFELLPQNKLLEIDALSYFDHDDERIANKTTERVVDIIDDSPLLPIMKIVFCNAESEHFGELLAHWSDIFNKYRHTINSLNQSYHFDKKFHIEYVPKAMVLADIFNMLKPSGFTHSQQYSILYDELISDHLTKFNSPQPQFLSQSNTTIGLGTASVICANELKQMYHIWRFLDHNAVSCIDHQLAEFQDLDKEKRLILACDIFYKLKNVQALLPLPKKSTQRISTQRIFELLTEKQHRFFTLGDDTLSNLHPNFNSSATELITQHLRMLSYTLNNELWSENVEIPIDLLSLNWEAFKQTITNMTKEPQAKTSPKLFQPDGSTAPGGLQP